MHGNYWYEGLSQVKVRIVTTAIYVKYFCNTFFLFCFVYSFSSFMQFTFDVCLHFLVYLIIILI